MESTNAFTADEITLFFARAGQPRPITTSSGMSERVQPDDGLVLRSHLATTDACLNVPRLTQLFARCNGKP